MSSPFVVSMKFTADARDGVAGVNAMRSQVAQLGTAFENSKTKAADLQRTIDARGAAAGNAAGYRTTLDLIRAEQQLESARLSAQISETGRNQSLTRLAQLGRDAASAAKSLAVAEIESANAAQVVGQSASEAAVAMSRLADQQERVAALRVSGVNQSLGVRDDFGGASRAADIEAYGREMDALRAKFSPLFALEQRHRAALGEISQAYKLGAINAREMNAAVKAEEAAFARSTAAIDSSTTALRQRQAVAQGGSFQTANVAAQFQDIAVTSAMGMSPLQIALQQGTQISAAFGTAGAAGAVKMLGAAFVSIISPVSLVTIGLVAGAAAAIQYFSGLGNGAEDVGDRLDDHLKKIEALAAGYDGAIQAAKDYVEEASRQPEGSAISNLGAEREAALKRADAALDALVAKQREVADDLSNLGFAPAESEYLQSLKDNIQGLDQLGITAASTRSEIDTVHETLTALANDSSAPDQARQYARDLLDLVEQFKAANIEAGGFKATIDAFPSDISVRVRFQAELAGEAMASLRDIVPDQRSRFDVMRAQNEAAMERAAAHAVSYGTINAAQEKYAQNIVDIDRLETAADAKKASTASKQVSAYDRQIKTIKERTAALEVEANVIGLSTFAQEKARTALELENAAREDAIGLSATRLAQIDEEATAYARVAAAVERQQGAYDQMTNAAESSIDKIVGAFGDAEADIGEIFSSIADDWRNTLLQLAISNPLKNALLGQNNPTLGDAGGWLGSIFSGLFGGGGQMGTMAGPGVGDPWAGLRFASGTNSAPGGFAMVNEQGEEIRDLPGGTRVWPAGLSRMMAANAAAQSEGQASTTNELTVFDFSSGTSVRKGEESDRRGGRRPDYVIEEAVGSALAKPRGAAQQALGGVGALTRR